MAPPKVINNMTLTGNVGGEPIVQSFTNETTGVETIVTDISIALYGGKLDKDKAELKDNTFTKWINARFRGTVDPEGKRKSLAEQVAEDVKKGDRVTVFGRPTFYVKKDENGNMLEHKDNDNVRWNMEATDIVILQKDPNAGGGGKNELPPL